MRSICAVASLSLVAVTGWAAATPRAVVDRPIEDFGFTAKGKVVQHDFKIRNAGGSVLEITSVRPACGCTVARFDERIAPGAVGVVHVSLDTSELSGRIAKSVSVFTNDPANPVLELEARADVRPLVGMRPGYARFVMVQGERGSVSQLLWAEDGRDLRVLDVRSPYSHLRVAHHEASAEERDGGRASKQAVVTIEVLPDAPVGPLRDFVEVAIDHPEQPAARIPVSGFIRPRLHATPSSVDFGELRSADLPAFRTIELHSFASPPIEILAVESRLAGVSGTVERAARADEAILVLTLAPSLRPGSFESVVRLRTSDAILPVFELPIRGTIR